MLQILDMLSVSLLQRRDSHLSPYKHLPPTLSVLTLQQLLGANRFAVLPFGDPITRISISN